MTAAERAAELCRMRGYDFREAVEAHLLRGYVHSSPNAFILFRSMPREGDPCDLFTTYDPAQCDAWYVWLGVGDARTLFAQMPYEKPWIGWFREGRDWRAPHWIPVERMKKVRVSTCFLGARA